MGNATRVSFGQALVELGREHKNIVVLDADLSKSTKSESFGKEFPDRFFQMGIQEANMIGVAAGLAFSGKIPFLCSFGAFLTGRFDTIRVTVGYAQANVRLVGTHAGVGIGDDGCSQMAVEDIACLRALPQFAVMQPADDIETKQMMKYLVKHQGPAYIRLTRQNVLDVNKPDYKFEFGKGVKLKDGKDAAIFATGGLTGNALEAAKKLDAEGFNIAVINIHTIKPLDREMVIEYAKKVPVLFSAEDHNIIGGLGGAIAETMAEAGSHARLVRIGVQDVYGESGMPEDLYRKHKLDIEGIVDTVRSALR